jgi:O-antigen chain-terminating methyltransferase
MLADRGVVIDIGCGRGEWLELMKRHGVDAYGVDVNDNIAQLAVQRGLEVKVEDGLEHLSELRSASAGLVSMFHVAEHLEFETLFAVVRAAHHALAPGGALVVETPNPTNLNVGAASFYRDPTHKTPLHPQLLEFLVSSAGFDSIELKFLHPSSEVPFQLPASLKDDEELKRLLDHLNWALLGPQDYSIIAFKSPLQ